jgi:hypothetical protein
MKLKPSETNVIEFEITVKGVNRYSLSGCFRILIDTIEYGFPAAIDSSIIKVSIPPLDSILKRDFANGDKFSAKLEIVGDGHHMVPWSDEVEIETKFEIGVKIKNEQSNKNKLDIEVKTVNSIDSKVLEEKEIEIEEIKGELEKEEPEINSTERIMRKVLKETKKDKEESTSKTLSGELMKKLGL